MRNRTLKQVIHSIPTSDGAGVRLRRSIGQVPGLRLDPFLMLDEFSSSNADDYVAGFPDHPHRGFETVTYMLDGHMLHRDHLGNEGDLRSGGAQWMTAGRGIIHSEMPKQEGGRMRGFQLWLNLPAKEKMKPAAYRDIPPEEIPEFGLLSGGKVRVIAGTTEVDGCMVEGAVRGLSTAPLFLDVRLPATSSFATTLPSGHSAFVYPYEGYVEVGPMTGRRVVAAQTVGVFSPGANIKICTAEASAAFLLLAARPLQEPVVQYGPFVMNTREEIEQAIQDYQSGQLV